MRVLGTAAASDRRGRGPAQVLRAPATGSASTSRTGASSARIEDAEGVRASASATRCWCGRPTCSAAPAMAVASQRRRAGALPRARPPTVSPRAPGRDQQVHRERQGDRDRRRRPRRRAPGPRHLASTWRTPACTRATRRWSLPPQRTYLETMRRIRQHRPRRSPRRSQITGPFNIQFIAREQRREGDRVQPAGVAQLPVRLEGLQASTSSTWRRG